MRKFLSPILAFFALPLGAWAQLSTEQKLLELQQLGALYAKQYAPYEWKRDVLRFDLFDLRPWMDRMRATRNDIEFYEVMSQYVSSLNDVHAYYLLPSTLFVQSGITTDLYDGKVLIDSIDRNRLPAARFGFQIGDEVVSVDGRPVDDIIRDFSRFVAYANERATQRWAADSISRRSQQEIPRAIDTPDMGVWVIRRASGETETFQIPWRKSGSGIRDIGPVPNLRMAGRAPKDSDEETSGGDDGGPKQIAPYLEPWLKLQYGVRKGPKSLRGFGALAPTFSMPQGFVQRLGRTSRDFFFSGTYESGGKRIGFVRIPSFDVDPVLWGSAITQFEREIQFFKANTDGIVVDVMRNPGGYGCYGEELVARLTTQNFSVIRAEIRATLEWVRSLEFSLEDAEFFGAEDWEIAMLEGFLRDLQAAYRENRGRTGAIPLCSLLAERQPALDRAGNPVGYDKPLIVLTDEFSTSAGDILPALVQDNAMGKIVGWRSAGAGGSVAGVPVGFFSEGATNVTQSLLVRKNPVATPDYPMTAYIENVGVRPEVQIDYMTRENLVNSGRPFVNAFTEALLQALGSR